MGRVLVALWGLSLTEPPPPQPSVSTENSPPVPPAKLIPGPPEDLRVTQVHEHPRPYKTKHRFLK